MAEGRLSRPRAQNLTSAIVSTHVGVTTHDRFFRAEVHCFTLFRRRYQSGTACPQHRNYWTSVSGDHASGALCI